jgi:hypothetical protein
MPGTSLLGPRLLAATDDSKNPSRAMRNEVPMASLICVICDSWNGHLKVKRWPDAAFISPMIATPLSSQSRK